MPWPKNHLPKYRKHRASGQAVVTLSGVDHYLGLFGSVVSRSEYDRLVSEWLAANRRSSERNYRCTGITVVEVLAAYLEFAKGHYSKNGKPTSECSAMVTCIKRLNQLYGRQSAEDFGPLALKAVRNRFVELGMSRTTVNQNIRRIVRIFRWAAAEELISPYVPQALSMVAGLRKGRSLARETDPVLPIDDHTVDATLPHLPAIVADMVRLQRLTGMRPAELCILRPCDVDRSGEVWTYTPSQHKTEDHGRERTIFIGPKSQAILLRYLARDAETFCFRPCDSEAKRRADQHASRRTPLSCGNRPGTNRKRKPKKSAGECYATDSYRRAIHRACDKAFPHPELSTKKAKELTEEQRIELAEWQSKQRWSPNRLRHTAATEIRREFGLEASQVMLGHSHANVTQIYAERDRAKGVEVARQIG